MTDLYFTKQNISENITFSQRDRAFIEQCRSNHNRLGFAYQIAFVYLTGYFPLQDPLEIIDDLLCFTATELGINSDEINKYSKRRQTIAEHQEKIRIYLKLRRFGELEINLLKEFLYKEACRLEQTSSLMAKAQEFLRNNHIILPANYTIRRIIGEQRDAARKYIFTKLFNQLSFGIKEKIEELLVVKDNRISTYQMLKETPGYPSPQALLKLIDKINYIKQTGIIEVDISWINNNFQKLLARKARTLSAYRIKEFQQSHKYSIMICFLWETYRDTVDYIIEMHNKLITNTYTRAENELGSQLKKRRQYLNTTLSLFKTIGKALLNEELCNDELRTSIFNEIPPDKLKAYVNETEEWLSGKKNDVFTLFTNRFSYLRQYSPSFLENLSFNIEAGAKKSLLEGIELLKELNSAKKYKIPNNIELDFIPPKLKPFVKHDGQIDRRGYECALLTVIRDEIKRGNIWVNHSKRFIKLDDFFISNDEWKLKRKEFFMNARLPENKEDVGEYLKQRLNQSYDKFLKSLPTNIYVKMEKDGWSFSKDVAEKLEPEEEQKLEALKSWLSSKMRTIKLPDLLIEVDNEIRYSKYFISSTKVNKRSVEDVCTVISAIMAYGCNIGPFSMAQLTNGISYDEIKHVADWYFYEENLKSSLADVVNAIAKLETTLVWGEGKTSSSDGQRFLFPQKVLQRTYSHGLGDFALEFYSFIADNYAPFYTVPIECTERDAAYVLDGLLYHESDLDIEEHYVDSHGYTELNFAAFAMLGKKFCPRIRGLHHQLLYKIEKEKDYGPLTPIVEQGNQTIHLDWICDQWDRMGQFYSSLQSGHITASVALKRLVSYSTKNDFYKANRELGRIFKTEFILDYLSDPLLRKRIQRGLLKGEQLHYLARCVHYGKQGKIKSWDFYKQMNSASCLLLILACIVYWQIKEIERIFIEHNPEDEGIDSSMLAHISPIGWDNIILYGQYVINRNLVQ